MFDSVFEELTDFVKESPTVVAVVVGTFGFLDFVGIFGFRFGYHGTAFHFGAVLEEAEGGGVHGFFQIGRDILFKTKLRNTDTGIVAGLELHQFFQVFELGAATGQDDTAVGHHVGITGVLDLGLDGSDDVTLHTGVDDLGQVVLADLYGRGVLGYRDEVVLIALVDDTFFEVLDILDNWLFDKSLGALHEVRARGGRTIVLTNSKKDIDADDVVRVDSKVELLAPLLLNTLQQLFAYYMAVERGNDVDQPRNLAKSVTVE